MASISTYEHNRDMFVQGFAECNRQHLIIDPSDCSKLKLAEGFQENVSKEVEAVICHVANEAIERNDICVTNKRIFTFIKHFVTTVTNLQLVCLDGVMVFKQPARHLKTVELKEMAMLHDQPTTAIERLDTILGAEKRGEWFDLDADHNVSIKSAWGEWASNIYRRATSSDIKNDVNDVKAWAILEVVKDPSDLATQYLREHHEQILPFLAAIKHTDTADMLKARISLDKK